MAAADEKTRAQSASWNLLGGFGTSHPGLGQTHERVETIDIILQREGVEEKTRGRGWYENRRSLLVEFPLHLLVSPREPPMVGVYFLARWRFVTDGRIQPYVLAGGGPVYTRASIPGTSSNLKGSYQAGFGVRFKQGTTRFSVEYRYHHLSNGGIKSPNDSLNSSKILFGVKLPF